MWQSMGSKDLNTTGQLNDNTCMYWVGQKFFQVFLYHLIENLKGTFGQPNI